MPDGRQHNPIVGSTVVTEVPAPVREGTLVIHLFLGREAGGITSATGHWIPAQMAAGWRHMAFCLRPGAVVREMERFGIPAVTGNGGRGYSTLARFSARLRHELARLGPAIIHAHNPAAQFYAAWHRPRNRGGAGTSCRVVRTVHADSRLEMKNDLSLPGRLFWNAASAWAMKRTDGLICVYERVRECLPPRYQQQAVVIPNGLNAAQIENSTGPLPNDLAQWLGDDRRPMVLSIGRLVEIKRFDWLIDCWARTNAARNGAKLVILGEGTLRGALQAQIDHLGLGAGVRLQHWTSDIGPVLKRACLTVIASRSEAAPMVLLESMAASVPLISTPVGNIPDVLENGVTGWFVNHPDDNQGLRCDELVGLLDRLISDPAAMREAGRQARQRLTETYSHTRVAARRAELYNRLLELD